MSVESPLLRSALTIRGNRPVRFHNRMVMEPHISPATQTRTKESLPPRWLMSSRQWWKQLIRFAENGITQTGYLRLPKHVPRAVRCLIAAESAALKIRSAPTTDDACGDFRVVEIEVTDHDALRITITEVSELPKKFGCDSFLLRAVRRGSPPRNVEGEIANGKCHASRRIVKFLVPMKDRRRLVRVFAPVDSTINPGGV